MTASDVVEKTSPPILRKIMICDTSDTLHNELDEGIDSNTKIYMMSGDVKIISHKQVNNHEKLGAQLTMKSYTEVDFFKQCQ